METKKPTVKILVACHKNDPAIRQSEIYMPIQVGKALHPETDLGFQADNTGDNISEKNNSYCELTALYWAWKNLRDVDYVGLAHYRRYYRGLPESPAAIAKVLQKYDVITVYRKNRAHRNIMELTNLLTQEDAAIMMDTLLTEYPSWKDEIIRYFYQSHISSQCNMMIMSRELNDEYCAFLFPLLAKIEERLLPHSYSRLKRNIGYMAEVIMGLWLSVRKLRAKRYAIDECVPTSMTSRLKPYLTAIKNSMVFAMRKREKHFHVYSSVVTGLKGDGIVLKNLNRGG